MMTTDSANMVRSLSGSGHKLNFLLFGLSISHIAVILNIKTLLVGLFYSSQTPASLNNLAPYENPFHLHYLKDSCPLIHFCLCSLSFIKTQIISLIIVNRTRQKKQQIPGSQNDLDALNFRYIFFQ